MPLYVADYLADTMHLSTAQHGAYLLLIMHYWRAGGLPQDDETLARICRMHPSEWAASRATITAFFDAEWRHARIDAEIARSTEKYGKLAEAGRRGGSRKRKPSEALANDRHLLDQNPSIAEANSQPQPQPQEDRMVDARARSKSSFTEGSKALASAFHKSLGFNQPIDVPAEFASVEYRAIEWEKAGWTIELVSSQAKRLALDQPLKPLTYFEKVFATAFAKQNAPLPVSKIQANTQQTISTNGKTYARSGSLIAAIDREIAGLESEEVADPVLPQGTLLRLSD